MTKAVAATTKTKGARSKTKASIVEGLLMRPTGATLDAIAKATSWQAHSCRAFLTGLRKKGREVTRKQDDAGTTIYLMAPPDNESGGAGR